nr:MAG TPA: hypothetical protein [Caudoviricetes sp.]
MYSNFILSISFIYYLYLLYYIVRIIYEKVNKYLKEIYKNFRQIL